MVAHPNRSLLPVITSKAWQSGKHTRITPCFPSLQAKRSNPETKPESLPASRHCERSEAIWEAYQNHSLLPVITSKALQSRNQTRIVLCFPSLRAKRSNLEAYPNRPAPRYYKRSVAIWEASLFTFVKDYSDYKIKLSCIYC
jgi:hypothetical protein